MLCAACANSVPPPPPLEIPAQLLHCRPAPDVPGEGATQRDLALFILDLDAAGADCRAKLGAVRGIVGSRGPQCLRQCRQG